MPCLHPEQALGYPVSYLLSILQLQLSHPLGVQQNLARPLILPLLQCEHLFRRSKMNSLILENGHHSLSLLDREFGRTHMREYPSMIL